MSTRFDQTLQVIFIALLLQALALVAPGAAQVEGALIQVTPGQTVRRGPIAELQEDLFAIDARPGVLLLAAQPTDESSARPAIRLWGAGRDDGRGVGFRNIRRAAEWMVVEILYDATYYFSVASEDPRRALGAYRLDSAFSLRSVVPQQQIRPRVDPPDTCSEDVPLLTDQAFGSDQSIGLTEDIDEEDCDLLGIATTVPGVLTIEATGAFLEATLFAGESCNPTDQIAHGAGLGRGGQLATVLYPSATRLALDPAGGFSGEYELRVDFFDLCTSAKADDHGDHVLCASPLEWGSPRGGELSNAWRDDLDHFTFELAEREFVELALSGLGGAFLELSDERGQLLGTAGTTEAEVAALIRSLAPGRYFVRVSSPVGSEGSYRLQSTRLAL